MPLQSPPWRRLALATAWLLAAALWPRPAVAAFASASVVNVGVASQEVHQGPGLPLARAQLSGGGPLLPWEDGQGSFIVGAQAGQARGDLHGFVQLGTVGRGVAAADTDASVLDTFTLLGTQPRLVQLRLAVQGAMSGTGQSASFSTSSGLSLGDASSQATVNWHASSFSANPMASVQVSHRQGQVEVISDSPANTVLWLSVQQLLPAGVPISVHAFLGVHLSVGQDSLGVADFSHTAQLWLGLPSGTAFTSGSGVFLTEAPLLVPEPGPSALLLAGLPWLAWRLRLRRPGRRRQALAGLLLLLLGAGASQAEVAVSLNVSHTRDAAWIELRQASGSLLRLAEHCGLGTTLALVCSGGLGGPVYEWRATRLARADDQAGLLGVGARMDYAEQVSINGASFMPGAQASASLRGDRQVDGGAAAGWLALRMDWEGAFGGAGDALATATASLNLGVLSAASGRFSWVDGASGQLRWDVGDAQARPGAPPLGQVQYQQLEAGRIRASLATRAWLAPGDTVTVVAQLSVFAGGRLQDAWSEADFAHTARLAWTLDDGLALRPAADGFLQALPVPEPGIAWLWPPGLAAVLWGRARRTPAARRRRDGGLSAPSPVRKAHNACR